ncbi:MAG: hypothetical protein K6F83_03955 [Clostridiales bacterium]|nr:hypothetical protein [Clostridiales bacterium]
MKENEWTDNICRKLSTFLNSHNLYVETLRKIPYSQEIDEYTATWETKPQHITINRFETDMVVFEKNGNKIIPRVIIESKLANITTHDAITYSYKAEKHKSITPFLRYGIMLGNTKNRALPGRLFRHGTNFDFMFSFIETDPTKTEWDSFTEMIMKEVDHSRTIEAMLHDTRSRGRKHYYMLQKELVLKELDDHGKTKQSQ